MAAGSINSAAGGKPPAVRASGPVWRDRKDRPVYSVALWPNQSLTRKGLAVVMGITAAGFMMPLAAVIGTPVFWGLIPFLLLALAGMGAGFQRNAINLRITETLSVWRDEVRVERREPNGRVLRWQADTREVRVRLHKDARIEEYLTLKGAGREIELGAFLAPEERVELASQIEMALTRAFRA